MCKSPMIPTYRYSVSSPMPLDLNEDHSHQLYQAASSSSSQSYSVLFNPDQDQGGSYYCEPKRIKSDEEVEKFIPYRGSWDHPEVKKDGNNSDFKLKVLKKEDGKENLQAEDSLVKCMPPKMRIMRRMMADQKGSSSNNNSSISHNNITVRVCADCHTTKTPLWRSGPKGPKSVCNACGIRQRKARRALAAAALENGTILVAAEKPQVKGNKFQSKGKRSKTEGATQLKRKRKHGSKPSRGRNKFSIEDFAISLSKNLAPQQVFPRDEKEAAILLMALSYGLLHGFPSDRYLDLL